MITRNDPLILHQENDFLDIYIHNYMNILYLSVNQHIIQPLLFNQTTL